MVAKTEQALANDISTAEDLSRYSVESNDLPSDVKQPTIPLITIPTSLSGGEVMYTPALLLYCLTCYSISLLPAAQMTPPTTRKASYILGWGRG